MLPHLDKILDTDLRGGWEPDFGGCGDCPNNLTCQTVGQLQMRENNYTRRTYVDNCFRPFGVGCRAASVVPVGVKHDYLWRSPCVSLNVKARVCAQMADKLLEILRKTEQARINKGYMGPPVYMWEQTVEVIHKCIKAFITRPSRGGILEIPGFDKAWGDTVNKSFSDFLEGQHPSCRIPEDCLILLWIACRQHLVRLPGSNWDIRRGQEGEDDMPTRHWLYDSFVEDCCEVCGMVDTFDDGAFLTYGRRVGPASFEQEAWGEIYTNRVGIILAELEKERK